MRIHILETFESIAVILAIIGIVCVSIIHALMSTHWSVKETLYSGDVQPLPILMWWTERLYPHFDTDETEILCDEGSCLTTTKREYQQNPNMKAFIFYGTDLKVEHLPLPRKQYHEWALFHEESPLNNFLFSHFVGISLFNHTATFRNDSDYPLTTQFLPSLEYLTEKKPVRMEEKNRFRREHGFAPVLYVQTHCSVPSDRDRYVAELSKFIQIDSYGLCLNNKSLPDHLSNTSKYDDEEFLDFISRYKFHLAFENAICDDYITEKLYRSFHVGAVPIYRGAATVRKWIPDNHSIILADDFESPEKLALFIQNLDENDDAYSQYLSFKIRGVTNPELKMHLLNREWGVNDINRLNFINGFECFICNRVLKRIKAKTKGFSYARQVASHNHLGCPEPQVSLGTQQELNSDDEWLSQGWQEDYSYSLSVGLALEHIIRTGQNSSDNVHEVALTFRD